MQDNQVDEHELPRTERRYREWRATDAGQQVLALFEHYALQLGQQGRRFGFRLIAERVRWEVETTWEYRNYKIDASHIAYIAREIVRKHPWLEPLVEFRALRSGKRLPKPEPVPPTDRPAVSGPARPAARGFVVQRQDGLNCPFAVCERCGQAISDIHMAGVAWRPSEDVERVVVLCKTNGCLSAPEYMTGRHWIELGDFAIDLLANSGLRTDEQVLELWRRCEAR